MTHLPEQDPQLEDLLSALTDAVLMENDLDVLMEEANGAHPELASLVDVIRALSRHLTRHIPADSFVQDLKHDLISNDETMLARLRAMPLRVHIATGLAAIVAGIMFLMRRRMQEEDEPVEEIMSTV